MYLAQRHQPHVHRPNTSYPNRMFCAEGGQRSTRQYLNISARRGGDDFQTELESHPLHYKFATPVLATPIHSCLSPPTTSCVLCLALRLLPLLLPILPLSSNVMSLRIFVCLFSCLLHCSHWWPLMNELHLVVLSLLLSSTFDSLSRHGWG